MTHPPIDGAVIGKHPLVSRFMRGVFNSRPPQPRYVFTWDVATVLNHIRSLGTNASLSKKDLTRKPATILALANARCSKIHALDVNYMKVSQSGLIWLRLPIQENNDLCFILCWIRTSFCVLWPHSRIICHVQQSTGNLTLDYSWQ